MSSDCVDGRGMFWWLRDYGHPPRDVDPGDVTFIPMSRHEERYGDETNPQVES